MDYVDLPDKTRRRLPFYLAMEEYLARKMMHGKDLFFMWQVEPTIIFGRNQIIDNEVNVDYCRANGIEMYRRKSGGGCVFANMDNIMMSYITDNDGPVATTFSRYTGMVTEMLRSLGLDASDTSRNDILISGRKVSGNAFYHIPGRSIVHGTMLFDTDRMAMAEAITPSKSKTQAKGVESVRSRVTTLSEHLTIGIEEFKAYVRKHLCDSTLKLTAADVTAIEEIERPYYTDQWIFRARKPKSTRRCRRIEGVGEFQIDLTRDPDGRIADLDIAGDFFLVGDADGMLVDRLRGVAYDRKAVADALEGFEASDVVYGMTNEQLIDLLF